MSTAAQKPSTGASAMSSVIVKALAAYAIGSTSEKAIEIAKGAMITARAQLEGGWESSRKSARAAVLRMAKRRDGVATRESVNYITRANGAAIEEQVEQLEKKINALSEQLGSQLVAMQREQQQQLAKISELLEKKKPTAN